MVSITAIVWNSGNRDEEIVKSVLLEQPELSDIHQAEISEPGFGRSRGLRSLRDGPRSSQSRERSIAEVLNETKSLTSFIASLYSARR